MKSEGYSHTIAVICIGSVARDPILKTAQDGIILIINSPERALALSDATDGEK
jgi:hypothetical protein